MSDPAWPVQQAIFAVLDAALPAPVYDLPPSGVAFPYVTIGDDTVNPAGTKVEDGHSVTIAIHAWSRAKGRGEAKRLLAHVYDALHGQSLAVAGHAVASVRFEFADSFLDADGRTWHGVARYRLLISS